MLEGTSNMEDAPNPKSAEATIFAAIDDLLSRLDANPNPKEAAQIIVDAKPLTRLLRAAVGEEVIVERMQRNVLALATKAQVPHCLKTIAELFGEDIAGKV